MVEAPFEPLPHWRRGFGCRQVKLTDPLIAGKSPVSSE